MAKPKLRNNAGQFQKYATVYITKQLEDMAKELEVNITKVVEEKLLETYKNNVLLSYSPRSQKGREVKEYNEDPYRAHRKKLTYHHTGTFINSIDTEVDNKLVKVIIRDNQYENGKSTTEIYKYLTEGTVGGGTYPYRDGGETKWAYNYPTPAHLFEEHTKLQMKGFLDNLNLKEYSNQRRYKKKWR